MSSTLVDRFEDLLEEAKHHNASDIHLLLNQPPMLRITGEVTTLKTWNPLNKGTLLALAEGLLDTRQLEKLDKEREICVSYFSPRTGRHRITIYHRMGVREMSIRIAQSEVLDRDTLMLPSIVDEVINNTAGLLLVTGPTGSGKTTTLNYMVDAINKSLSGKIVTIEDPVEFEHHHIRSIVTQIEVGTDTLGFSTFLRSILRLDPDVIVIGEMRDLETTATALTSAETGHLVMATLHTPSAIGTAERMVNIFPVERQPHAAVQVASTMTMVLSQRLLPKIDKSRRVLATEVLLSNNAVRNIIREREFYKLQNAIQMGIKSGMHSLESSLAELYRTGNITLAAAHNYANSPALLDSILKDMPPPDDPLDDLDDLDEPSA